MSDPQIGVPVREFEGEFNDAPGVSVYASSYHDVATHIVISLDPEEIKRVRATVAQHFVEKYGRIRWCSQPLDDEHELNDWLSDADAVLAALGLVAG